MTLSKYTNNLYQSEVYRELERQAVKKGFFKPTDAELVKLAAQEVALTQQINKSVDTTPSDDLMQDVARLAFAMRRKGFVTQAEELEQKLVMYKKAENELYGVTAETNADLIGFAHRDGDVNLIEGSGDLGTFETMQSIADKILAVTRKQPTGNQPMNRIALLAKMITKTARTSVELLEDGKEVIATFEVSRKTPPSYDGVVFDLEKYPKQIPSYIYFSGNKTNAQTVVHWFNIKAAARSLGVLIDGAVPSLDINKLSQTVSTAGMLGSMAVPLAQDKQNVFMAQAKGLLGLALVIGVLPQFQQNYIFEGSPKWILQGGLEVGINQKNLIEACQFLSSQAHNVYVAAFGENNSLLATAQNGARNIIATLYDTIQKIDISIKDDARINSVIITLAKISRDIETAKNAFEKQPSFNYLANINADQIDIIKNWVVDLKAPIDAAYKDTNSGNTAIANIDINHLLDIYNNWDQADQQGFAMLNKLIHVIKQNNGLPWEMMKEALHSINIDEKDMDAFQQKLNSWSLPGS
jgi:hypothetical protein